MKDFLLRLLEVFVATALAGAILLVYNGLTTGEWHLFMLGVVPIGFIWSMYLGVLAISNIAMGLFLVLAALVVLAAYLIARFGTSRWLRVPLLTAVFLVHQLALIVLFAMLGVTS
jgi:hypothetical protein